MLPRDLCPSDCTGAQIALGTGLHIFQLIPIRTSAEFDSHSSASSALALTRHHTHIHTQTHVNYHFHVDPTAGSLTPQSSSFRSKPHFCQTWVKHLTTSLVPITVAALPQASCIIFIDIRPLVPLQYTVSQCVELELLLVLISLVSYRSSYCVSTRPCTFLLTFINIPLLVPTQYSSQHDFFNPILW